MSDPKLGYLLKKFPRLSETFILNELLAQEQRGRSIHIFSRRAADDEPRHPQLAGLKATVETIPHPRSFDPWALLFDESWNPEEIFAGVGRLVALGREWEHPRFASLLNETLLLLKRTRELGLNHLHVHFATDSAIVAMLLQELGGPSYSITAHAKDIYRNTVRPELLERLIAKAKFVVTVCDANARYLEQNIGKTALRKVRRLYNGIDLASFRYVSADRDTNHVLSVGRLVEKKGFDVLLQAAAQLKARGAEFKLSIVGTGDEADNLARMVRELELGECVELLGALDQGRVRELMSRATILSLPCVIGDDGNRDALPTVLLEALACGLPCVSTPVTGIPEILDDGNAGLIVPERDPTATADAMAALLGDAGRRDELARKGRSRAEQLFDATSVAKTLAGWFDEALNGDGTPCASPS